ncbi:Bacterial transcriptional regulator (plasmid) [Streptomyces sp. ADI95-16]|nr:Bacterial transcriptional regulator [Streptomyces sp. ADI95-16]AYV33157.1 Bacterial transcriptional regulator [Streptomyces sp. ADI95-16]RPK23972.1 Bacterial transcriptional regulator [Streptomyces sp. ADI91-18]
MRDREFKQHLEDIHARPQVPDRYADHDMTRARARLLGLDAAALQGGRRTRGQALVWELHEPGPETAVPPARLKHWLDPRQDHPADAADARRALGAVCLRSLFTPDSGSVLDDLVERGPSDWRGPLVFACLLHLLGHDGARFWWQLAAAAGSDTAVYCLYLDHSRHAEYDDAEVWAAWLDHTAFIPLRRWGPYINVSPKNFLPPTLTAYIEEQDDDLLGIIPAPSEGLVDFVQELVDPARAPALLRQADTPERHNPLPGAERERHAGWSLALTPHQDPDRPSPRDSDAIRRARIAERVVDILQQHPLGATDRQISRDSGVPERQLHQVLAMLIDEDFARPMNDSGVYAPGPALDRLASPGGLMTQLQHTLALARDSVGAAVYLSRYTDGEVRITQMADGPITPAVTEWVDFRAAAHASAVGKCLLTQLDTATRLDHLARHKAARLTPRTITSPRILLDRLERITPDDPVFDLREYSPNTVCAAVPVTLGTDAGSLALSLPYGSAHRLGTATQALTRKAVPVLLTLLLAGAQLPTSSSNIGEDPVQPRPNVLSQTALDRLRRRFRTPLSITDTIRDVELPPTPGPHLTTRAESDTLYLFAADPAPPLNPENAHLALPHTYTTRAGRCGGTSAPDFDTLATNDLLVFGT